MKRRSVHFENRDGQKLTGILAFPPDQHPQHFAIFAHCFTCTKNLTAIVNISRALTLAGIAVLRFDFTGLGESEGEFADTNFSGNVDDLLDAAAYLDETYQAPSLLIGHSLGGSACIFAADELPSVNAVAVIGAPADPAHVKNLLKSGREQIERSGSAVVNIGGRDFKIKKQFLDDLENKPLKKIVRHFKKALMILHSPQDKIVGIDNAEEIYTAAFHPKSYVSLDGADHLLSNKDDSRYAGEIIAVWVSRYIKSELRNQVRSDHQVAASTNAEDKFTTYIMAGNHRLTADEPEKVGGSEFGPTPYDFLSTALAACTAMTVQMYARRKEWKLENVTVHINHSREHATDCLQCEDEKSRIDTFRKLLSFEGDLSPDQTRRLMEIADRCPVHRTLTGSVNIVSQMEE